MAVKNNVINFPARKQAQKELNNMNTQYEDNSRGPIRFDKLRHGSTFRIVAEPSRGIYRSKDTSVYKKDHNYFYSTDVDNAERSIVLYPQDLVMPVVKPRSHHNSATKQRAA